MRLHLYSLRTFVCAVLFPCLFGWRISLGGFASRRRIMSISEEKRVAYTKLLRDLRDSVSEKVVFDSSLTSDERKFVHKISQDYGLKSKSQGKDEKRFITVTKKGGNTQKIAGVAPILWAPHHSTVQGLNDQCFQFVAKNHKIDFNATRSRVSAVKAEAPIAPAVVKTYGDSQAKRIAHSNYQSIQRKRNTLPASHYKQAVCNLLKEHQIVLISGETGCGKSTQVPQFLLDDDLIGPTCRMAITQPRRISAVAVAERIASERSEAVGATVGYMIRLDSEKSASTQLTFMTPGVLLRKLLTDPLLLEYTHIVVDEAHERDRFTEFLQIILRDICAKRPDLKLILMSATMHTDKIRAYFGDIPQINVGGSVFPVQEYYLEHVLKFTHFMSGVKTRNALLGAPVAGSEQHHPLRAAPGGKGKPHTPGKKGPNHAAGGAGASTATPLSKLNLHALRAAQYHCALCNEGPFESPEELGTHSATCYPGAPQKNHAKTGAEHGAEGGLSRLDSLAASINAIRMAKGGSLHGTVHAQNIAAGIEDEQDDENRANSETDAADTEDTPNDDDIDAQLDQPLASASLDLVEGRTRAASEEDTAVTSALLSAYQAHWDDSQVDVDLIFALLKYVFSSAFGQRGSVLVFLPGWDEIATLHRMLSTSPEFSDPNKFMLLQLHSGIQKAEQDRVFHSLRPGQHKIILSTNIAETSITIDDVVVVVNAGRAKEKTYDPHTKLGFLQTSWISQASARQRRGRAGRTQAGVCFHLYSSLRSQHLSAFQDSELLRMPLEEIVLQAKSLGVAPGQADAPDGVTAFLLKAMDPPHQLSIRNAISLLQMINCLDEQEQVTSIGAVVSQLPLSPRMGRMILLGCLMGVGPTALATAACMGYRDPFIMPATEQQRAQCNAIKARLGGDQMFSDQVVAQKALAGFTSVLKRSGMSQARRYCDENNLSFTTMQFLEDLVGQLSHVMHTVNVQPSLARAMRNSGNAALLQAVVGTGLYPDVGVRRNGSSIFSTERACKAKIHSSSINARVPLYRKKCEKPVEVIGFQDLIASAETSGSGPNYIGGANLMMLGTTPLSVFALLLTCGNLEETSSGEDNELLKSEEHVEIEADGWFSLQMHRDHFQLVQHARHLLAAALASFLRSPHKQLDKAVSQGVERIAEVLTMEQQNCSSYR